MKNMFVFSFLALLVFLLPLLATAPARAAQTGTVTITGRVPPVCDITVLALPASFHIADISQGDTHRQIATVTENCNSPNGYTVSVGGTNSTDATGLFVDTVSGDSLPFDIAYDSVDVPANGVVTDTTAPGINLNKPVDITYAADASLTASAGYTYQETLTFTIAAK